MNVVGFDFGTTNSLVSLVRGDRAISFFDELGLPIPSVVCYEAGNTIVGREAKRRMATAGLGVYGNIVRSPKMLLGQASVFVDGVERSVTDVVADLVKYVRIAALASPGRELTEIDAAVVTIPVNFDGARRAALRDAFRLAGIRITQFVHEPLAALYEFLRSAGDRHEMLRQYERQLVLVFDWGGGTLDLTLCRVNHGTLLQVANDGTDEVGGDRFDEAVRNEVIRSVRERRLLDESTQAHPDAAARLLHLCEQAKIDLSGRDGVQIYLNDYFRGLPDGSFEHALSREELERIAAPLVDAGLERIRTLLEAARVSPAQIALCLATGGMVNMPMIKSRLHEMFGAQRVRVAAGGGAAIAEGAAWIAHDRAGLRLAKDVELLLARNSHLPIIKAGTEMPREREVCKSKWSLYCVDPRDGFAKLQLLSPLRPGSRTMPNDRRHVLGTMAVKVDPRADPFLERIDLLVEIDDNLVLHSSVRSSLGGEISDIHVHTLEFGVAIGGASPGDRDDTENGIELSAGEDRHEKGSVTVRANVAQQRDPSLVPGELWHSLHPEMFDIRRDPPRIQVDERLYYEPCATCGRASNDPACRCGSAAPSR
jgi:molecular chaperone DnaK